MNNSNNKLKSSNQPTTHSTPKSLNSSSMLSMCRQNFKWPITRITSNWNHCNKRNKNLKHNLLTRYKRLRNNAILKKIDKLNRLRRYMRKSWSRNPVNYKKWKYFTKKISFQTLNSRFNNWRLDWYILNIWNKRFMNMKVK